VRLERGNNLAGHAWPIERLLLKKPHHEPIELVGNTVRERTRRLRVVVENRVHELEHLAAERPPTREHLVDDDAESPEVRADLRLVPQLFRSGVLQGSDELAVLGQRGVVQEARDAEVEQHRRTVLANENVRWFDVAVNDAGVVKSAERPCDLSRQVTNSAGRKLAPSLV